MFEAFSAISIQLGEIFFFFLCCWWFGFVHAGPVYKSHYE
jgi:hypothetical protein